LQLIFPFVRKWFALSDDLIRLVQKYTIHIVHSPAQYLPESKVPTICTMHDVQELYYPSFFSSAERARRAVQNKRAIDNSTKVIVSYNHIKNDIIRFFDRKSSDVHVIHLNVENLWFEKYLKMQKENINESLFLLYPAATWAHKNHINLVKAIFTLQQKGISIKVICTGHKTDYFSEIGTLIDQLSLTDNFDFKGIVSDADLYQLYQNCYGVIVPTLYEAGSFPLMESIMMNVPVICSNITSLPETIGDMQFTFNPHDVNEIASLVERFYTDKEFYNNNRVHLKKQSQILKKFNALPGLKTLYSEIYNQV
jgi:glycosyltransferase involved in cell wall biosynthesis